MNLPKETNWRGLRNMNYRNLDLKIDQFIAYVNDNKINLIPPFQRGHVWTILTRRKLIENIVRGRPIPAIFLYREASGDKYEYNILDGKQRLESLILFVGNKRESLSVKNLYQYFHDKKTSDCANFSITLRGKKKCGLKDLEEGLFRDFQEYVIPTIEITLSEDDPAALDEMIDLFVDINSYGEQVRRFDIVKAMSKDKLLANGFNLIARRETRGKDIVYKPKDNEFTRVLKKLQIVDNLQNANSKVDRMWELLVEIVLFLRSGKHRTPIEILNSFIKTKDPSQHQPKISRLELSELRKVFRFLALAYKNPNLNSTRLVTNQIHFYTMITSIISAKFVDKFNAQKLIAKLSSFGQIVDGIKTAPRSLVEVIKSYQERTEKHTTHPSRRLERQEYFIHAIEAL